MQSVYLLVLLGASALVQCQICNVQDAENPVAGINLNETEEYPESKINEALAADARTAKLIAAAAKETEIQTKFELSSQRQYCRNLPCPSRSHYCVPTNYKVYIAWFWCNGGGFQFRKFRLPQCCECQRFCFNNVIIG